MTGHSTVREKGMVETFLSSPCYTWGWVACLLGFRGCLQVGALEALCLDYRLWQVVGGRFIARARTQRKNKLRTKAKATRKASLAKDIITTALQLATLPMEIQKSRWEKERKLVGAPGGRGTGVRAPGIGGRWGPGGLMGDTFFATSKRRKDSDTLWKTESLEQAAISQRQRWAKLYAWPLSIVS